MTEKKRTAPATESQELFKLMASAIQNHLDLAGAIDEAKVRQIAQQTVAEATLPRTVEIARPGQDGVTENIGLAHRQFEELVALLVEGHKHAMLVGPAGTGKTTMAKQAAKAIGRDFAFISLSAGVTETHIFGRMLPQADGTWAYRESAFVRTYRQGGVFLFDEIDGADANVMVSVNAALANGILCNPVTGEVIERHAECIILAAANTFGRGGDLVYAGRNALDGATLDRFVLSTLFVDYDTALERALAQAYVDDREQVDALMGWVAELRERIATNRLRRIASTRLVEQAAMALRAGASLDEAKARYFQSWSRDETAKVGDC